MLTTALHAVGAPPGAYAVHKRRKPRDAGSSPWSRRLANWSGRRRAEVRLRLGARAEEHGVLRATTARIPTAIASSGVNRLTAAGVEAADGQHVDDDFAKAMPPRIRPSTRDDI